MCENARGSWGSLTQPPGRAQVLPEGFLWFCPATPGSALLRVKGSPCQRQGTGEEPGRGLWGVTQVYCPKVPGELSLFVFTSRFFVNHLESY